MQGTLEPGPTDREFVTCSFIINKNWRILQNLKKNCRQDVALKWNITLGYLQFTNSLFMMPCLQY